MHRRHFLLAILPIAVTLAGCATPPPTEQPAIVFFTGDSAALEAPALEVIRSAAAVAQRFPAQPIQVMGFAGPTGGRPFNQALSRARAEHVVDELTKAGVARNRISVVARGPVAFEFAELESRRVEIRFGS